MIWNRNFFKILIDLIYPIEHVIFGTPGTKSGVISSGSRILTRNTNADYCNNHYKSLIKINMGREVRLFKSEEPRKRNDVVSFLKELAGKIEEGKVVLKQGSEELVLEIPENLILDVKAEDEDKKKKGTQRSLEIEIKWFQNGQEGGDGSLELG